MRYVAFFLVILITQFAPAQAREVVGVEVPDRITQHADAAQLLLNGAGVRSKFLVKVYVGALYLPHRESQAEAILDMPGAKRVAMHFLHSEVSAEKLVKGWNDGFEANLSTQEFQKLRPRIANFNGMFPTVRKGDRIDIDIVPGTGTQVWLNGKLRGRVAGEDFARALLRIWLGDKPADRGLKQALLGDN